MGNLFYRVVFDKRADEDDGHGNAVGEWEEQFQCRARYIHLRAGETIMAGRLQGKHTQIIEVRANSETRQITTDWRVRDARTGDEYNIREIVPENDRRWISLTCERGVAV